MKNGVQGGARIEQLEQEIAELAGRREALKDDGGTEARIRQLANDRSLVADRISAAKAAELAGLPGESHSDLCEQVERYAAEIRDLKATQVDQAARSAAIAMLDREIFKRREDIIHIKWQWAGDELDAAAKAAQEKAMEMSAALARINRARAAFNGLAFEAKALERDGHAHGMHIVAPTVPFVDRIADGLNEYTAMLSITRDPSNAELACRIRGAA